MSQFPLFGSVVQALSPQGYRRAESYVVQGFNASAEGALLAPYLTQFGLPAKGDAYPGDANLIVSDISAVPFGPSSARVTYTFVPPDLAGSSSVAEQGVVGNVSFSVTPIKEVFEVPFVEVAPVSALTQEVDDDGQPTGGTLISRQVAYGVETVSKTMRTARITYTVNGSAESLGISNSIGSVGVAPGIVAQSDTIHQIGNMALLFDGVDMSWTQSLNGQRIYTLRYEWVYEKGVLASESARPNGFVQDPQIGPANERLPIVNSVGSAPPDDDFSVSAFYAVAYPDVPPPTALRNIGHIGGESSRYIVVPYCDTRVRAIELAFPVPEFYAQPRYERIDQNLIWQQFPGVG